ncbi:MAG: ribosome silencing factor [Gammaproteobacteria bacterium]|nr:ribosome silencing factor [Gammaproteobacteria bacterium]
MKKTALQQLLHTILEDMKATEIVDIDVHNFPTVTDMIIICSGRSSRHVKSVADKVVDRCKEAGARPFGCEGEESSEWIVVDLGDIIVHIMQPETRRFYDLEGLWQNHDDEIAEDRSAS